MPNIQRYRMIDAGTVSSDRAYGTATPLPVDPSSRAGAEEIIRRSAAFWLAEGYPLARFVVIEAESNSRDRVFCVRSNLVNGIPPRTADEAKAREKMLAGEIEP